MITVILPVYDGEKYISQAIESVLKQSYSDLELIIVNDGSTDKTENEIFKFKDDRIKYVTQSNLGPSAARNKGMSIAKGKYFAFIDADDLYESTKIEEQVKILDNKKEICVVYNDYFEVDEYLTHIRTVSPEYVSECRYDLLAMMLFRPVISCPSSIMIRRDCYDRGLKYNCTYKHGDDYDFLINLLKYYNFYYIHKPLYIYRKHNSNLTNQLEAQIKAEVEIVKSFTNDEIVNIVNNSDFNEYDKNLLKAKIFLKRGQCLLSLRLLKICLNEKIDSVDWFYIGICYCIENKMNLAEQAFKEAIKIDHVMAEAYNNLGCVYGTLNRTDESLDMFSKALQIRPNYMDASYNIYQLNVKAKDFKLTERELKKSLSIYHSDKHAIL